MAPRTSNIGAIVLFCLVNIFRGELFKSKFNLENLNLKNFIRWLSSSIDPHSSQIRRVLEDKISKRRQNNKPRSMFADESPLLQELGTEQMKQIFKAARAIALYSNNDDRIYQIFEALVPTKKISVSFIIGTKYIPSKCSAYGRNASASDDAASPFAIKVPKSFEVLLAFHAYRVVTLMVEQNNPFSLSQSSPHTQTTSFVLVRNTKSGNRIGFAVQTVLNAWNAIASSMQFNNCQDMISPYILFDQELGVFKVLSTRNDGFAPSSQKTSPVNVGSSQDSQRL